MTPIKRNLNYQFTDAPLRLRIRWAGNTLTLSTGYFVEKEKWLNNRCRINTTHGPSKVSASYINSVLEELENNIDRAFYKFEAGDSVPTKDQLLEELRPERSKKDPWSVFDEFVSEGERLHQWSFNTVKSVRQVKDLLRQAFPNLTLEDINLETLTEFVVYQQSHRLSTSQRKSGKEGYANNVIQKHCRVLKWFLKWGGEKGIFDSSLHYRFNPDIKTIRKEIVYLEWEELIKLYEYDFGERKEEDKIRDLFCFCSFTSLRYSDAVNLRKTDIYDDLLILTTQKTSTHLRIDLNRRAKAILDKYAGTDSEFALPRPNLAWMNKVLKKIGKELEFRTPITISQYYGKHRADRTVPKYELLSSHCARRTFISNAIQMGIAPHIVMKWSGHTTVDALKPYLEIADQKKREEMKKFDR